MNIRLLIFILISCNAISCRQTSNISENQKTDTSQNKHVIIGDSNDIEPKIEKPIEVLEIDSNSFEFFKKITDYYGELPQNLVDSFLKDHFKDSNDYYRAYYGDSDVKSYSLKDATVLTFRLSVNGVCALTVLCTFDDYNELFDSRTIKTECDADMSSPDASFDDYKFLSDTLVEIIEVEYWIMDYSEEFEDSLVRHGIESFECDSSKKFTYLLIHQNGQIEKFEPVFKLLTKEDLIGLNKNELRLKRNEIYARYGRKFRSTDLVGHFSSFDWYRPLFDNVIDSLNFIDKINIELIQKLEE